MVIFAAKPANVLCLIAWAVQHIGVSLATSQYPPLDEGRQCVKGLVCLGSFYLHGKLVVLPWMVVFAGVPLATVSLIVVHSGFRTARSWHLTSTPPSKTLLWGGLFANAVMCSMSLAMTGLSLYLALQGVTIMVVFMASGFLATFAHTGVTTYLFMIKRDAEKVALPELIESGTEAAHAPLVTSDTPNSSVTQPPVVATYGVVPGTSEYALKFVVNMDDADYSKPWRSSDQTRRSVRRSK